MKETEIDRVFKGPGLRPPRKLVDRLHELENITNQTLICSPTLDTREDVAANSHPCCGPRRGGVVGSPPPWVFVLFSYRFFTSVFSSFFHQ